MQGGTIFDATERNKRERLLLYKPTRHRPDVGGQRRDGGICLLGGRLRPGGGADLQIGDRVFPHAGISGGILPCKGAAMWDAVSRFGLALCHGVHGGLSDGSM